MKTKFFFFAAFLAIFSACTNDDSTAIAIKGRVLSEITNEPVAGAKVIVQINDSRGQGTFSYTVLIDSVTVTTDANGNFTAPLDYEDGNNYVTFDKLDDEVSTAKINMGGDNLFYCKTMSKRTPVLYVRKFEKLRIKVKNVNPVNAADQISVSVYEDNTSYGITKIYAIENFGEPNLPWDNSDPYYDGLNPWWKGTNVNSVITHAVQEGTAFRVHWNVVKNGVSTQFHSDAIPTISGAINEFEIYY